jgi:hypothetical protein
MSASAWTGRPGRLPLGQPRVCGPAWPFGAARGQAPVAGRIAGAFVRSVGRHVEVDLAPVLGQSEANGDRGGLTWKNLCGLGDRTGGRSGDGETPLIRCALAAHL